MDITTDSGIEECEVPNLRMKLTEIGMKKMWRTKIL